MSISMTFWPSGVERITRVRLGAALSVKPPAIVIPSRMFVSLSSVYPPGFLTSPKTK